LRAGRRQQDGRRGAQDERSHRSSMPRNDEGPACAGPSLAARTCATA
jgi:hypothetical protein